MTLQTRQPIGRHAHFDHPAFLPIRVESLRVDKILQFDIYVYVGKELVLYRSQELPFTEQNLSKLRDNKVEMIYIAYESRHAYQRYLEDNLPDILRDPQVEEVKKAEILYDTSKALIKEVFSNPTYSENIKRSQDMV
ncbi:MAG: hypothetical protein IT585_09345, partial [candidate division Zixibacteria bacterium]|nr:hypothetical protein [candidate division Zixibacteria bacterium]